MEQAPLSDDKINTQTLKFDFWTEEILQLMPLDNDSLVFSGNLLTKSYLTSQDKSLNIVEPEKVEFIDLYLLGSDETKKKTIEQIVYLVETVFEQNISVGATDGTRILIMIQCVPRIIRLLNTTETKPSGIFNSMAFAHQLMYWSNTGLHISPFAKLSIEFKQVLPNPNVRHRVLLDKLYEIKNYGLSLSPYIEEFPMIDFDDKVNKPKHQNPAEFTNFYIQTKNLQSRDDVFRMINHLGLKQVSLHSCEYLKQVRVQSIENENFLQEEVFNIAYNKPSGGFSRGTFCFGRLDKIIMDVHVEECYKLDSNRYFYFLSINNPNVAEKFKNMVKFCLQDLTNSRTCILNSRALDPNEREIFNVSNTLPNFPDVMTNIKEFETVCDDSDKLCFLALYDKQIESHEDQIIIFTLYNLKTQYISHTAINFEKVFVEIFDTIGKN